MESEKYHYRLLITRITKIINFKHVSNQLSYQYATVIRWFLVHIRELKERERIAKRTTLVLHLSSLEIRIPLTNWNPRPVQPFPRFESSKFKINEQREALSLLLLLFASELR